MVEVVPTTAPLQSDDKPEEGMSRRQLITTLLAAASVSLAREGCAGEREEHIALRMSQLRKWYRNIVDSHTNSNDLQAALDLRHTPLRDYPGVHRDKHPENILQVTLPAETIARYFEGTEKGPLIIFVLGNGETVDKKHGAALVHAYQRVCNNDQHALITRVGTHLARPLGKAHLHTDVLYQHFLNITEAIVNKKLHTSIILVGYSWGGGTIHRSLENQAGKGVCDLDGRRGEVPIKLAFCIDPVHLGTSNFGLPINHRPDFDCSYHHVCQEPDTQNEAHHPFSINRACVTGPSSTCAQKLIPGACHMQVDEQALLYLYQVIAEAR